jgi:phage head maturation protease
MADIRFFLPISKIDKERRTVEGVATTETLDKQSEIVDYNASKSAFADWGGAIREMHEPKAVGKAVEVVPDDDSKTIRVKAYISKGAEDTWTKLKEGILTGFSIGGRTIDKATQIIKDADSNEQKMVTRITKYQLNELSLVDNPANPDATVSLVKRASDGMLYQTESVEDIRKVIITDTDSMLEAEIRYLRDKADALAKKARTTDELDKLDDDDFGVVRKYTSSEGKQVKERLLPMPDKVHAQTVLKKIVDFPLSDNEREQVHEKAKSVLGASHKNDECKLCKKQTMEKATEGDVDDMALNEEFAKQVSSQIDALCKTIDELAKAYAAMKTVKKDGELSDKDDLQDGKTVTAAVTKAAEGSDDEESTENKDEEMTEDADAKKAAVKKAKKAVEGSAEEEATETEEEEAAEQAAKKVSKTEKVVETTKATEKVAEKSAQADNLKKIADLTQVVESLKKSVETLKTEPLPRKYAPVKKAGDNVAKADDTLQKDFDECKLWMTKHPGQSLPPELQAKANAYVSKSMDRMVAEPDQDIEKI